MIIDLSLGIENGMLKYASDSEPKIVYNPCIPEFHDEPVLGESGFRAGIGFFLETLKKSANTEIKIKSHHGTHIDSPAHKVSDGKKISDYPLEKFVNPARLIDFSAIGLLNRDKRMIIQKDIEDYLTFSGYNNLEDYLEDCSALIFYTGFCNEMKKNQGNLLGDEKSRFEKTFPYFNACAAYLLSEAKGINIIGIDSFAVDPSGSKGEIHKRFFSKDILVLETLVNLNELKKAAGNNRFMLYSAPIPYVAADAAQTRAFAIVDEKRR